MGDTLTAIMIMREWGTRVYGRQRWNITAISDQILVSLDVLCTLVFQLCGSLYFFRERDKRLGLDSRMYYLRYMKCLVLWYM
ncbi:hypothetical protein K491DRAFT_247029 [Lophiostoma macrostomum CBS 122681]|uniref:Uncharacterized protein n=1 Tax=Lophiostoma macrostomum CBS 122681 TaxID=1314788 RepID=A0A6A6TFJ9_9PLEO|nr:hypothetical protein K491DRAFT_247029 [Lophiostoma macrostomum CBS 122681]